MLLHQSEYRIGDKLECFDLIGKGSPQLRQQLNRIATVFHRDKCRRSKAGIRKKAQRGRGDNAERSFTADKQLLQVVAGRVFAQRPHAVQHGTVGQHNLEPENEGTSGSIPDDVYSARIRRDVAADLAAALGTETQRKQSINRSRCLLDFCQDAARLDFHREIDRVDVPNPVHPRQRQQYLLSRGVRYRPAAKPGIPALWHDRCPGRGAGADYFRNLFCRSRHDK